MRILQVTPGYYPVIGGVERHVQAIAEQLAGLGHEVTVATMQPQDPVSPDETHNGVRVVRFGTLDLGDAYRVPRGLRRFISEGRNNWDVVHVHNYHALPIPVVALAEPRSMVVTTHLNDTPHSAAAKLLHYPYAVVGRWAVGKAQAVICVTEAERARVIGRLGVAPERTEVIPNGVNDALVQGRERQGERDPHLLLSVGRLQAYKRVEDAISTVAMLGEPYRLVIVGHGPHRPALIAHAEALGVSDRVVFEGQTSEQGLIEWYRQAGAVLNMSVAEAFGMTVLEAVATGCQVVCSDIPAFRDLASYFPNHVTIVSRGDARARIEAVKVVIQRSSTAPADVSKFTWKTITGRLVEVYDRASGGMHEATQRNSAHVLT